MNGVSLFANVGIAELYLKECGIDIVVANELVDKRADFYRHIYPECEMIQGDITDDDIFNQVINKSIEKNCKFMIATPPCQGMSVAGKRDYSDPRNSLILRAVQAIELIQPEYVIIENVIQQLKTIIQVNGEEITIGDYINKKLGPIYNINENKVLNAEDYGIPQNRKRAILLLCKHDKWEFPEKDNKKKTVMDTIGHLPSIEAIVKENDKRNEKIFRENDKKIEAAKKFHKWHIPKIHTWRHIEVMLHTETGETAFNNEVYYPKKEDGTKVRGYNTTYKRMKWDTPAPTITVANGCISSQCNVHPGRLNEDGTYSDARTLTIYELMLLSTIPDDWDIPEWASDNLIRHVIGEGIPPLLVKKIVQNMPRK